MAKITVELFGIPRRRAGTGRVTIESDAEKVSFEDVMGILAGRFPALAETCFDGRKLRAGYLASVGGQRFLADPHAWLCGGDTLLILSAEAGG